MAPPSNPLAPPDPALFQKRTPEPASRSHLWIVAAIVLVAIAGLLVVLTHRHQEPAGNVVRPLDAYAPHLVFTNLQMSESESLSGGKSTFIDGQVRNTGDHTVTAATLQVLFRNDEALPPQLELVPLTVIRTRQPYVDTQPLSAAPLAPGDTREFRLIFEGIGANWNQQLPDIHVVRTLLR